MLLPIQTVGRITKLYCDLNARKSWLLSCNSAFVCLPSSVIRIGTLISEFREIYVSSQLVYATMIHTMFCIYSKITKESSQTTITDNYLFYFYQEVIHFLITYVPTTYYLLVIFLPILYTDIHECVRESYIACMY